MPLRELSHYTHISHSVLTNLENETRPFRQVHIDRLTSFFSVTSDYLLGRSDNGYIVRPEYGDEEIILTESEYTRLYRNLSNTIINTGKPFDITITSSKEETKVVTSQYQIYRELKGSLSDYDMKETLSVELNDLAKRMTEDELKKTITFIENYIFK